MTTKSPSFTIRSAVALPEAKLLKLIDDLPAHYSPLCDINNVISDQITELQEKKYDYFSRLQKIKSSIEMIQNYDQTWCTMIGKISDENRITQEEALYTQCATNGYLITLDTTLDKKSELETVIMTIDNKIERLEQKQKTLFVATPSTSSPPAATHSSVKLPTLEIPRFNGDPKKWLDFIDIYMTVQCTINHRSVMLKNSVTSKVW